MSVFLHTLSPTRMDLCSLQVHLTQLRLFSATDVPCCCVLVTYVSCLHLMLCCVLMMLLVDLHICLQLTAVVILRGNAWECRSHC